MVFFSPILPLPNSSCPLRLTLQTDFRELISPQASSCFICWVMEIGWQREAQGECFAGSQEVVYFSPCEVFTPRIAPSLSAGLANNLASCSLKPQWCRATHAPD